MATCKACGAEIVWVRMESGKNMPCDARQQTVVIHDRGENGRTVSGLTPHWATCPKADQFRKERP